MDLKVVKQRGYVWRVNTRFGYEAMAWITGWAVFDGERQIVGGFRSGSNFETGEAYYSRKKDAAAFLEGYQDTVGGQAQIHTAQNGQQWLETGTNPYGFRGSKRDASDICNDERARAYGHGVHIALEEARDAARQKSCAPQ